MAEAALSRELAGMELGGHVHVDACDLIDLKVHSPAWLKHGDVSILRWSGGVPPFDVSVLDVGLPASPSPFVGQFPGQTTRAAWWTVTAAIGRRVAVKVTDAYGCTQYSVPMLVAASNSVFRLDGDPTDKPTRKTYTWLPQSLPNASHHGPRRGV